MNCKEAIQYIHETGMYGSRPGLDRIRALLDAMGNPQKGLRYVHVAGTNGKGSFCAMLSTVLREAGYRVGMFTSPYIRRFEERVQLNGNPIDGEELAAITEYVRPYAEALFERPTEFELITAIGFEYFRRHQVDVVVLEVGLGGRMDPTNIIESPLLSVITGIDFDHTSLLGNTIQAIAAEKAGIIKAGCPSLFGDVENSACRTIRAIAAQRGSRFYTVDRSTLSVKERTLQGTVLDFGDLKDLRLSLLGAYQPQNATTVLMALEILREQGVEIPEDAIRRGLSSVRWPARFELLQNDPPVIFDGGHNPQGVAAAVKSVKAYFPEQTVYMLSAVMADKNYDEMIEKLKPVTKHVFTVSTGMPRALAAEAYADQFRAHKVPAVGYADATEGIRAALDTSRREGIPLVCLGSLYLYNMVVEVLESQR